MVDFVGAPATSQLAMPALLKGGQLVVVGLFGGALPVPLPALAMREVSIRGSAVGNTAQIRELVQLVRDGKLKLPAVQVRPLAAGRAGLARPGGRPDHRPRGAGHRRSGRVGPAASGALGHPGAHRIQRRRQPRRIGAAGHRHVGLAAALAADLLGDEVDQLAGLDLRRCGRRSRRRSAAPCRRPPWPARWPRSSACPSACPWSRAASWHRRLAACAASTFRPLTSTAWPAVRRPGSRPACPSARPVPFPAHAPGRAARSRGAGASGGVTFSVPATPPSVPSSCCR